MRLPSAMEDPVVVSGVGVVCATGHSAPMAFTSVKAGVARIGQSPELFIRDEKQRRQVVHCAAVEGVTDGHRRFLRLYRLAVRAFAEAVGHAQLTERMLESTPIFVALAEKERPGLDNRAETDLLRRISQALGIDDLSPGTTVIPIGHAGTFQGLELAVRAIASGQSERAIVGGVDTYLDEWSLQWLFDKGRLKTEGSAKGFVPGEAAAFAVIERASAATRRQVGCYAHLASVDNAFEAHGIYAKEPCTGEGLTNAIRSALSAGEPLAEVSLVLCDLNGERHRAHEWGLAMSRCFRGGAVPHGLWHPADGLGDTGAASGAVNLVLGTLAIARGNASPCALAWGASDDGERGAAVLSSLHARPVERAGASWA